MDQMEPDPDITPDPETPQTSGLSASEPETRHRFPGIGAVVAGAVLIVVLVVVAIVVAIWIV